MNWNDAKKELLEKLAKQGLTDREMGRKLSGEWKTSLSSEAVRKARLRYDIPSTSEYVRKEKVYKPEENESSGDFANLSEDIQKLLKRSKKYFSVNELADKFDKGPATIQRALDQLSKEGYSIEVKKDVVGGGDKFYLNREPYPTPTIAIHNFFGEEIRFGVIGDTQICNYDERLDILNCLYKIYEREGIKHVYHAGDMIDGENVYKGQKYELHTIGADNQIAYCVKNYPRIKGITTHFIAGNHDDSYWKQIGLRVGERIAAERPDMDYLGTMEADIRIGKQGMCKMRLHHPSGGSSYADSYQLQKIIESYTGGTKPQILFVGHYHKALYDVIRNVHGVLVGCVENQTPFMRGRHLRAVLGGWLVSVRLDKNGLVRRFLPEFFPFFEGTGDEEISS